MSPKECTDTQHHPIPSLHSPRNALFDEFPRHTTLRLDKTGYFSHLLNSRFTEFSFQLKEGWFGLDLRRKSLTQRCRVLPQSQRGPKPQRSPGQPSCGAASTRQGWGREVPNNLSSFMNKQNNSRKKRRFRSGSWNRTGERWQCRNRTTSVQADAPWKRYS